MNLKTFQFKVNQILNITIIIVLSMLMLEKIYVSGLTTGYYSKYIFAILVFLGIAKFFVTTDISEWCFENFKKFLTPKFFLTIFVFVVIVMKGINIFSYTYVMILLLYFFWKDMAFKGIHIVFEFITLASIVFGFYEFFIIKSDRITGTFTTSPTLFSTVLVICFTYYLFKNKKLNFFSWLYSIILGLLIFLTGTRTSLMLILVISLVKVYEVKKNCIQKNFNKVIKYFKKNKLYIVFFIVIAFFLSIGLLFVLRKLVFRSNGYQSTSDRITLIMNLVGMMIKNPMIFLFGAGPGAATFATTGLFKGDTTYFAHQDILTVIFDYGFLLLLLLLMIVKFNGNKIVMLIFFVSTFHNVLFSPYILVLLLVLNKFLIEKKDR